MPANLVTESTRITMMFAPPPLSVRHSNIVPAGNHTAVRFLALFNLPLLDQCRRKQPSHYSKERNVQDEENQISYRRNFHITTLSKILCMPYFTINTFRRASFLKNVLLKRTFDCPRTITKLPISPLHLRCSKSHVPCNTGTRNRRAQSLKSNTRQLSSGDLPPGDSIATQSQSA